MCVDQKEIVRVNLLHATSFMQLISLCMTRLIHVTVSHVLYNATDAGFNIAHLFEKCFYVDTDKKWRAKSETMYTGNGLSFSPTPFTRPVCLYNTQ